MNEIDELKRWLKANANTLRKYAPDELAFMAHLCGFTWQSIHQTIPEAHRDLQTRSTGKLREDWWVTRELDLIERDRGIKLDCSESWHRLYNYDNGMESR